jgi:hypothetical protein
VDSIKCLHSEKFLSNSENAVCNRMTWSFAWMSHLFPWIGSDSWSSQKYDTFINSLYKSNAVDTTGYIPNIYFHSFLAGNTGVFLLIFFVWFVVAVIGGGGGSLFLSWLMMWQFAKQLYIPILSLYNEQDSSRSFLEMS